MGSWDDAGTPIDNDTGVNRAVRITVTVQHEGTRMRKTETGTYFHATNQFRTDMGRSMPWPPNPPWKVIDMKELEDDDSAINPLDDAPSPLIIDDWPAFLQGSSISAKYTLLHAIESALAAEKLHFPLTGSALVNFETISAVILGSNGSFTKTELDVLRRNMWALRTMAAGNKGFDMEKLRTTLSSKLRGTDVFSQVLGKMTPTSKTNKPSFRKGVFQGGGRGGAQAGPQSTYRNPGGFTTSQPATVTNRGQSGSCRYCGERVDFSKGGFQAHNQVCKNPNN